MKLFPCPVCGMELLTRTPKVARHPANAECIHSNIHVWDTTTQPDVYDFARWNKEASPERAPVVPPAISPASVTMPTLNKET